MKTLTALSLLFTMTFASANVVPQGQFDYTLNCENKQSDFSLLFDGNVLTVMPAFGVVGAQVEMKNQMILLRINNRGEGISVSRTYEKTRFTNNRIEITHFSVGLLGGYRFEDKAIIELSDDLSSGTYSLEYPFGRERIIRKCKFSKR